MSVPAASVVLSFSKKPILKLFSTTNIAQVPNILAELNETNDDVFVFGDSATNKNLISLEHSLGLGGDQMQIVLSFIDPENEFEKRFITTNLMEIVGTSFAGTGSTEKEHVVSDQKQLKEISKEQQKSEIEEYLANFGSRYVYVAYGVGGNVRSWAGPFKCILTGAKIDISKGKIVTIKLATTLDSIQTRFGLQYESIRFNLEGLRQYYIGHSQEITFLPYQYKQAGIEKVEINNEQDVFNALEKVDLGKIANFIKDVDIHAIVVDTLRNYVSQVLRTPNVIVLLPNINWICRAGISQTLKATKEDQTEDPVKDMWRTNPQIRMATTYRSMQKLLSSFSLELASDYLGEPTAKPDKRIINAKLLHGNPPLVPSLVGIPGGLASVDPDLALIGETKKLTQAKKLTTLQAQFNFFFENRKFVAKKQTSITSTQTPQHTQAINDIISGIQRQSKTLYDFYWGTFYESNINILELWKKYSTDSPLFFGGREMALEKDGTLQPVAVVGDIGLIKRFLYGWENLTKTKEKISEFTTMAAFDEHQLSNLGGTSEFAPKFLEYTKAGKKLESSKQQNITTVMDIAPIHPNDAVILKDQIYNEEIRKIVYRKPEELVGAFGSISDVPKGFDLAKEIEERGLNENYVTENSIPVFRYNFPNPNILDFKFNLDGQYLSELKTGFFHEFGRLASDTVGGILKDKYLDVGISTVQEGVAYLRLRDITQDHFTNNYLRLELIHDLFELYGKGAGESGNIQVGKNLLMIDECLAIYKKVLAEEGNKPYIGLDFLLPGKSNLALAGMANQLYRKAVQIDLKTLPVFHLSNNDAVLKTLAVLFVQDVPVVGSTPSTRSTLNKFASGLWSIVGFKHVINKSTIESNFKLVKNLSYSTKKEKELEKGKIYELDEGDPEVKEALANANG